MPLATHTARRPLRRIIQRELERDIAKLILANGVAEGDLISIGVDTATERIRIEVVRDGGSGVGEK